MPCGVFIRCFTGFQHGHRRAVERSETKRALLPPEPSEAALYGRYCDPVQARDSRALTLTLRFARDLLCIHFQEDGLAPAELFFDKRSQGLVMASLHVSSRNNAVSGKQVLTNWVGQHPVQRPTGGDVLKCS